MKKVEAIIQPEALESVKEALFDAEIHKMTVHRGKVYKVNLLEKIKIDIAVNDEFVEPCIEAIIKGARTGNIGDGKIFVTELQKCVRIRTGEQGNDAIG
jgi:nitrogen regulatory protein P-II 1